MRCANLRTIVRDGDLLFRCRSYASRGFRTSISGETGFVAILLDFGDSWVENRQNRVSRLHKIMVPYRSGLGPTLHLETLAAGSGEEK